MQRSHADYYAKTIKTFAYNYYIMSQVCVGVGVCVCVLVMTESPEGEFAEHDGWTVIELCVGL